MVSHGFNRIYSTISLASSLARVSSPGIQQALANGLVAEVSGRL